MLQGEDRKHFSEWTECINNMNIVEINISTMFQHGVLRLPLEPLGFYRQQMFNVSTAGEDAFQINPAPLNVNPNVKEGHDPVQFIFPAQGIFLKNLRGGRKEKKIDLKQLKTSA